MSGARPSIHECATAIDSNTGASMPGMASRGTLGWISDNGMSLMSKSVSQSAAGTASARLATVRLATVRLATGMAAAGLVPALLARHRQAFRDLRPDRIALERPHRYGRKNADDDKQDEMFMSKIHKLWSIVPTVFRNLFKSHSFIPTLWYKIKKFI